MKVKSYINNKLEFILNLMSSKSKSNFGNKISHLKGKSFNENGFRYNFCINLLRDFYRNEAEEYCLDNNFKYINELLFRRKEIKNQGNYLLSVGVGVGTGIPVGVFVNNINKISGFISSPDDSFLQVVLKIPFTILIFILIFIIIFAVFGAFKYFTTISNPLADYCDEEELIIIEEEIERALNKID